MAFYVNLFSPETFREFSLTAKEVAGFHPRHQRKAEKVLPGDFLVCYITRVSRWCGVLEVQGAPYLDSTPRFIKENDPYSLRFQVKPVVFLPLELSVPIHEDPSWNSLSFTKQLDKASVAWTGKVRASLTPLDDEDGNSILRLLKSQASSGRQYPLGDEEKRKLRASQVINRAEKSVTVSIPEEEAGEAVKQSLPEVRQSIRIQALVARIGAQMGLRIWIPKADRGVFGEWEGAQECVLDRLPLNYDDVTLRTIEQIDVLWLRGRSIVRAFEIEHTTSVYSGILRMADLLALQPNMEIKLHLVAPEERREKVFQEIQRPVFSLLEKGPLAEYCTYLSYDSIRELAALPHISHLSDSVLDEYAEEAQ